MYMSCHAEDSAWMIHVVGRVDSSTVCQQELDDVVGSSQNCAVKRSVSTASLVLVKSQWVTQKV